MSLSCMQCAMCKNVQENKQSTIFDRLFCTFHENVPIERRSICIDVFDYLKIFLKIGLS